MKHGTLRANGFTKQIESMKNLSKSIILILAAGVFSGGFLSQRASATLITGDITFSGQVKYDTGDPNTANAVTRWGNTLVQGADGSFAGLANTEATFNAPWKFNPSTPLAGLWSVGGFTFDLLTSTIVNQGGGFLSISGTGIITSTDPAFEATAGTWFFSSQKPGTNNGKFTFSGGDEAGGAVPDGGSALALLGIGLVAIETLRRRFGAAQSASRRVSIR